MNDAWNDSYIYAIVALLPLSALMLVSQVNPYHALVIRGALGAVAAMVYGILGAADVALTEALMGTMLAITLYAIAVRSSLVLRLGVLDDGESQGDFGELMADFRKIFSKRQMRLELVTYPNTQALHRALIDREVHATCISSEGGNQAYCTTTRIQRIYDIIQAELSSPATSLNYLDTSINATIQTTGMEKNYL
ncbi:MAG: DUF4040 domain-containing protein [Methylacidiphilales bacterium]|nr:DUF4040 domain-containing protein [Candidatus Methylacidiphilales bacterium]NJR17892.1 DUF4040 domain-containing protein [Calothrix sp. CSU_2_0]